MESRPSFSETLQITSIQETYSFFDLNISSEEQVLIDAFNIEKTTDHMWEPENLDNLLNEVENFLKQAGSNDLQVCLDVAQIILKQITRILNYYDKKTGQIIVRTFTETSEYDTPRWHIDGEYFSLSQFRRHNC